MASDVVIHFSVRCDDIREWERIHVVGNLDVLGNWDAVDSLPLIANEDNKEIWSGAIKVAPSVTVVKFRYLRVYFLDQSDEDQIKPPVLIISKWETMFSPRMIQVHIESNNGAARSNCVDEFGFYGGQKHVSDGWIRHEIENVVFFRIHGQALKFFKESQYQFPVRLKVVPFDVRYREEDFEDDSEFGLPHPEFASFSSIDLSVLTRDDPIFGDQYPNGSIFRNNIDYLVFRTRTVSIQNLAFRIELYKEKERIGIAYALPSTFPNSHGSSPCLFVGQHNIPIGKIEGCTSPYQMTALRKRMEDTGEKDNESWRSGIGGWVALIQGETVYDHGVQKLLHFRSTSARENTIYSLNEAARRGADYVELDVQLTKDLKTVVYHDFHVLVNVAGRDSPTRSPSQNPDGKTYHEIAIKDLTYDQLIMMHFEHISKAGSTSTQDGISVTPAKDETNEEQVPFPSLAQVLRNVDKNVGINIEIKYPMFMKDGSHECVGYFEQNKFVDVILKEVFENAEERRIMFSCFDPDVCTLIRQKQHKYPVLFLVVGATTRYMPFQDIRSDCSKIAANFAAGCELLGVNFHSEELLNDQNPIEIADRYNLIKIVWGDDLNSKEIQTKFKKEMNIDGLIFDRIGEDDNSKQNVFIVESQNKNNIFKSKPPDSRIFSMSRRCFSVVEESN